MPAKIEWLVNKSSDDAEEDEQQQQKENENQDFVLKRIARILPPEVNLDDSCANAASLSRDALEESSPRLVSWPPVGLSSTPENCMFTEKVAVLNGPRVHIFSFKVDEDGMIEDEEFVKSVRLSQDDICEEADFSPDGEFIIVGDSAGFAHFLKSDGDLLFRKKMFNPDKMHNAQGDAPKSTFCAVRFTSVPAFCEASPDILMCSTNGEVRRLLNVNLTSIEKAKNGSDLRSIKRAAMTLQDGIDNTVLSIDQYWTAEWTLLAVAGIGTQSVTDIYQLSNTSEAKMELLERFTPESLDVKGVSKVVWDHFGCKLALVSTDGFVFLFHRTSKGFERFHPERGDFTKVCDFEFIPPDDVQMLSAEEVPAHVYVAVVEGGTNEIRLQNVQFRESTFSVKTVASLQGSHFENLNAPSSGFAHIFSLQLCPTGIVLTLLTPTPEEEQMQSLTDQLEALVANGEMEKAREFANANDIPLEDIRCAEASVLSSRITNQKTGGEYEDGIIQELAGKLEELNGELPTFVSETCLTTFCQEHSNQQRLLEFGLRMSYEKLQEQSSEDQIMDLQDFIEPFGTDDIDTIQDAYTVVYFTLKKWRCWKEVFSGLFEWRSFVKTDLSSALERLHALESLTVLWEMLPYPRVAALIAQKIIDRHSDMSSSEVDVLTDLLSDRFTSCLGASTVESLERWGTRMTLNMAQSPTNTMDAVLLMTVCLRGGNAVLSDCLKPVLETKQAGELETLRLLKSFRDSESYWQDKAGHDDEKRWDQLVSNLSSDDVFNRTVRSAFPSAWRINSIERCLERDKLHQTTMNFLRECSANAKSHWLQLLELFLLRFQHNVSLSLEQFQEMTLDGIGIAVLDNCQTSGQLRAHIKNHFVPFCRRHNVHADALLNSYVQELCCEVRACTWFRSNWSEPIILLSYFAFAGL
eukprot:gb/GECG01007441.1/.p1 GENE.gb/GECG01007441.1/~~gb/GECG01007441.1/.p1  ORF type:complete len:921 (+),score=129.13 gb/GECG01007441.1/:1-2763(+)